MSDEWGPWIEHDGKGCPCVGMYVHVVFNMSNDFIGVAGVSPLFNMTNGGSWNWRAGFDPIIRYRIRKPRGLIILQSLIADLPEPVRGSVDA